MLFESFSFRAFLYIEYLFNIITKCSWYIKYIFY